MAETFPYHYRAFGLQVASEFQVTGFESSATKDPDVVIRLGNVPDHLEKVINKGVLFQSNDHEFLINMEPIARYYICDGKTITINSNANATDAAISTFLTGTSFGALLHQRRLLPLHASTVFFENKCLMFMGISGAGKSTLASALLKEGATLIADDISVVDFSHEEPEVIPSFPTIKIWKDSLRHLGISHEKLIPVRQELEKFYLPVEKYSNKRIPVDLIFVLSSHNKPEVQLNSVSGIQKFQMVKRHTYLFRGIPKTGLEANHFQLAGELIRQVPVYVLIRPNAGFNTDNLIAIIKEHLSSHG